MYKMYMTVDVQDLHVQDLLSIFTMGSDWTMDPILHLVERSSGIIDPTLGSTDMSVK